MLLDQRARQATGADEPVGHRCGPDEQASVAAQLALEGVERVQQRVEVDAAVAAHAAGDDHAASEAAACERRLQAQDVLLEDRQAGVADGQRGGLGFLGHDVEVVGDALEPRRRPRASALRLGRRLDVERPLDRLCERAGVGHGGDPGHALGDVDGALGLEPLEAGLEAAVLEERAGLQPRTSSPPVSMTNWMASKTRERTGP
ncbi:MAG: hypothetical protein R2736_16635 [Solirubrobacterales bacterium]